MAGDVIEGQFERVWFGPRFVALIIDWVVLSIVWMIVGLEFVSSTLTSDVGPCTTNMMPPEVAEIFLSFFKMALVMTVLAFAYFVFMEAWIGATIGKRIVGILTMLLDRPTLLGLPFGTAFWRELVKQAGFVAPHLIALVSMFGFINSLPSGQMPEDGGIFWFFGSQLLGFFPVIWLIWIGVSLVNNRDPIYDRAARTTVVRV